MNKASGGDGIPVELFQILKDDVVKVLHLICQQIWNTQQWPQDWKRSVFIPIPKKGNAKECSNYRTIAIPNTNASKFNPAQNGLNWLYKIIHNEAVNYNRRDYSLYNCELTDEASIIDDCVDDWLDKILIKDALNQLSAEERLVIYLRYWEGLNYQEVAKRINKPLTTTYDYINKILKKLKKLLK